ncbi:MAG: response regulator [Desulfobacteria bacterium]|nr:response regulator transcription factor [Deltaproteobacteria bacterium]MDA8180608.1 response regulator transcription factor [Deltaproteobacteria bacterium]HQT98458.1 response regulator transcription factor [Thermodesulfobacteriota bacterium]
MINVYLVDDHDVIRAGIKQILELDKEIRVVGEASRALDAVHVLGTGLADLVFMDIRMPGMNGIEATRILTEKIPNIKVILLTNFNEEEYVVEGLRAGAAGFLLKNIGKEELHKIVHAVYEGKSFLDPAVTSTIIKEAIRKPKASSKESTVPTEEKLTTREFEILDLVSRGLGNKDIGSKLHLSEYTVKFHVKAIFRKLGAKSRSEAVYKAVSSSLISQIPGR